MKKFLVIFLALAWISFSYSQETDVGEGQAPPETESAPVGDDTPPPGMSQKKYDAAKKDATELFSAMISVTEAALSGLTGATDAKAATKAVNTYTNKMRVLKAKSKQFDRKYRELKKKDPPPSIASLLQKFGEVSKEFGAAIEASGEKFGTDKKYLAALKKLTKVMK